MRDIFDTKIICKTCDVEMQPTTIDKAGFQLRAIKCYECGDKIIHPDDMNHYKNFNNLRGKRFNVKLRVVGNSHAVSIPKEIVNFIREQERIMDDMVSLCFEDMGKLSLMFGNKKENDEIQIKRKRIR